MGRCHNDSYSDNKPVSATNCRGCNNKNDAHDPDAGGSCSEHFSRLTTGRMIQTCNMPLPLADSQKADVGVSHQNDPPTISPFHWTEGWQTNLKVSAHEARAESASVLAGSARGMNSLYSTNGF